MGGRGARRHAGAAGAQILSRGRQFLGDVRAMRVNAPQRDATRAAAQRRPRRARARSSLTPAPCMPPHSARGHVPRRHWGRLAPVPRPSFVPAPNRVAPCWHVELPSLSLLLVFALPHCGAAALRALPLELLSELVHPCLVHRVNPSLV